MAGQAADEHAVSETMEDAASDEADADQPDPEQIDGEEPVELLTVTEQTGVDDPAVKTADTEHEPTGEPAGEPTGEQAGEPNGEPVQMTLDEAVAEQMASHEQESATQETSAQDDSATGESAVEAPAAGETASEESTPEEAASTEAEQEKPPLDEKESESGEPPLAESESAESEPAEEVPPDSVTISDEQIQEGTAEPGSTEQEPAPVVQKTKEPIALLNSLKSGFGGVVSNVKKLDPAAPFKNLISKTKEKIDDRRDTKSDTEKGDAEKAAQPTGAQVTAAPRETKVTQPPKEPPKVYDAQERRFDKVADQDMLRSADGDSIDDRVKKQFDNLDMMTTSAIAIMLSDTKSKTMSPYIKSMSKPDVRPILFKFCKDSYHATDIEQLNRLYSKTYYKLKIARYLYRVTVFVKRGIGDTLPRRIALTRARVTKNRFINKICETLNSFESVKYISALSGNEKLSDSKRNYKLDHLSENYKDALIYLMDLLLTCTCISKMLFVERMIKRMSNDSEFKKIIYNMTQSIDDHNLIINKSRPIYKQYYQAELGYINGDDLLYGMAITIMVNNAKKKVEVGNTDILELSDKPQRAQEFKTSMLDWLDKLAVNDDVADIGTLILQKITLSIKDNYYLLISALGELTSWESYYSYRVAYYNKERDKDRYLKGDFSRETEEFVKIK